MNQEKIGSFITMLRKEKEMTQSELAEKLRVSSVAVCKWEKGRCLPDISLFNEICSLFEISLDELLAGEKNKKNKGNNEIITDYIKYKEKRNRKMVLTSIIISLFIIVFTILSAYFLNSYKNISAYKLYGNSENFSYDNGLFIKSKMNIIYDFGNLSISNKNIKTEDIIRISIFNIVNNERKTIYSGSSLHNSGAILNETYGYNDMFVTDNYKDYPNNFVLVIKYLYNDKIVEEEIKLENKKIFVNDKIITKKIEAISNNEDSNDIKREEKNYIDIKEKLLENGYNIQKDNQFVLEKEDSTKYYTFNYINGSFSYQNNLDKDNLEWNFCENEFNATLTGSVNGEKYLCFYDILSDEVNCTTSYYPDNIYELAKNFILEYQKIIERG